MRLGLLLCGDVHTALQPMFDNYAGCLIERLQLRNAHIEVRLWHAWKGELPDKVTDADAYLVGGSPASVFDRERWIDQLGSFIRQAHSARRRLVGICFGHQMIHHALGGRVERADAGWGLGIYPINLSRQIAGLSSKNSVALYAMHQDQVITPAEGFELLGGSEFCPHYMMSHADRVLTIQGHPEFTHNFFAEFLKLAESRFDEKSVARARLGMLGADDGEAVCQMLNGFVLGRSVL